MAVENATTPAQTDGVCFARGFRSGTAAAGIRGNMDAERLDLVVLSSDPPATAAAVFTKNVVKAAPVLHSQKVMAQAQPITAVAINSGNANACTAEQGLLDAAAMCAVAAAELGCAPNQVLVCSTGVIGRPMPMVRIENGLRMACQNRGAHGKEAARAIMTTDTVPKTSTATFTDGQVEYRVGAMAKGSGMIHPDMATLLVFITTDAAVARSTLQSVLADSVDESFNCITVDGDTSTNDTAILLANGAAGGPLLDDSHPLTGNFRGAVSSVCRDLAEMLVADAEGATKYFHVSVSGAPDVPAARQIARVVAGSPLVKTAIYGADPNWGRILAAAGRAGFEFSLDECAVEISGVPVFVQGRPDNTHLETAAQVLHNRRIEITVRIGRGPGTGQAWGCDLTPEYVHVNASYTT